MTIVRSATPADGLPTRPSGRHGRSPARRRPGPPPRLGPPPGAACAATALGLVALLLAGGCAERARETPPPRVTVGVGPVYGAPTAPGPPPAAGVAPTPLVEEEEAPPAAPLAQPVIRRGSGVFINPQPTPPAAEVTEDGEVTLSFVNADLREVVRVVLADILGLNYLVAPEVGGTVTIQTERPIPRDAVLDVFERALQLSGAALVRRGDGVIEVVPTVAAPQLAPRVDAGGRATAVRVAGYGVEIVPLRFVAASEMLEILQPILSPETVVQVDAGRNLLVVAGSQAQRRNIAELVDTFDVDWLRGQSVGLFPLQFSAADAIAGELGEIFASGEAGAPAGVIRFVPVERLNAVLAISTQAEYLDRAQDWIRDLDQGQADTAPQVYVYYVQNKRAADLAAVLTEIFAPGTAPVITGLEGFGEVAPGRTGVEILAGPTGTGGGLGLFTGDAQGAGRRGADGAGGLGAGDLGGGLGAGDEPLPGEAAAAPRGAAGAARRLTQRLGAPPRPGAAAGRAAAPPGGAFAVPSPAGRGAFPGIAGAPAGAVPPGEPAIRIIADDTSNALVILATPRDYRRVEAALRRLDIVPLQVLIEATIAEVTLTDRLAYGLQWFFESGDFAVTLSNATTGAVNQVFPGFSAILSGADARVVLNALASVTDLNVISAPQLLVIDNQTAVLQVGDQVPIATQQVIGVEDPDAPVRNSIEYRDTGTILLVTPRVNAGGLVTLEVEQEISDAVETLTSGINSPTIQRRLIQTTVAVQSGETLALGGLIRDRNERTRAGVPLLMDIPILGNLFRRNSDDMSRTEILILITPRVVRNEQDARRVTDELRQRLRSLEPLEGRIRPAPRAAAGGAAPGT